jgi:hypothetical protein
MKMFNQATSKPESKPEASHSENDSRRNKENGDMAGACCCEELVELDDGQLATVVGGLCLAGDGYGGGGGGYWGYGGGFCGAGLGLRFGGGGLGLKYGGGGYWD